MVKLKELLNEYGKKTSELVGTRKKVFGRIYQMQDEMAKGKFNPNNPQIYIEGQYVGGFQEMMEYFNNQIVEDDECTACEG